MFLCHPLSVSLTLAVSPPPFPRGSSALPFCLPLLPYHLLPIKLFMYARSAWLVSHPPWDSLGAAKAPLVLYLNTGLPGIF